MDRKTKLAYRQRGSRLRRFSNGSKNSDGDDTDVDNLVVIRTPLRLTSSEKKVSNKDDNGNIDNNNNNNSNSNIIIDAADAADAYPAMDTAYTDNNEEPFDRDQLDTKRRRIQQTEGQYPDLLPTRIHRGYYKQLRLNNAQLDSITVIRDLIDNLVERSLLFKAKTILEEEPSKKSQSKSKSNFNPSISNTNNLMSLDIKIFKLFNEGVRTDLKDIKDINEDNNAILKQLSTQIRRFNTLIKKLKSVRTRYSDVVKIGNRKLNGCYVRDDKLVLNEALHSLTRSILLSASSADNNNNSNNSNSTMKSDELDTLNSHDSMGVERLCELLDPTDGLVARLRRLRSTVESEFDL